jgi:O-antigen ligase
MKSSVWDREAIEDKFLLPSPFPIFATIVALLVAIVPGLFDSYILVAVAGALVMTVIIIIRQNQLALTIIMAVHVYIDWYMGFYFVAPVMALALLVIFFLARSPKHPWIEPPALWLWLLFLAVPIFSITRGLNLHDSEAYYITIIFSALIIFWLGLIVSRDIASIRRLFEVLAIFGMLMAVHTIIEALTGIVLFKAARADTLLAELSYFEITGTGLHRAEAFFLNPDSNATFFAMIIFLPLGLFVHNSSFLKKMFYLVGVFIILPALLFTYSTGSWLAALAGSLFFIIFVGRSRYRILIPVFMLVAASLIVVIFPAQVAAQFAHFGASYEWPLRIGGWLTALNVIQVFPLIGLGMGSSVYIVRADPYRVPEQFIPLDHPHNSYLEFATQGGLPLLIVFLGLLSLALWKAWHNWALADARTRSLLGGGGAAVLTLCFNSLVSPGWTFAPLASIGWLILGAISSPLLAKSLQDTVMQEKNDHAVDNPY